MAGTRQRKVVGLIFVSVNIACAVMDILKSLDGFLCIFNGCSGSAEPVDEFVAQCSQWKDYREYCLDLPAMLNQ